MTKEKTQYSEDSNYWDRKKSPVMGDLRQRPRLLELLGDVKNKKILEGGCGTGFFSRKIAGLGAEVYGCDIESGMLNLAIESERREPLGIKYDLCDIKKTIYEDSFFDKVVSVGVLFHLDKKEWGEYLRESHRILKSDGELIISIEHPFIFTKFSPTRNSSRCWAVHTSLEDKDYNESQQFEEKYYKADGDLYTTNLWHHPLEFTINAVIEAGFQIKEFREVMVEKEDLISDFWGTDYGYPAFLQLRLGKS